MTSAYSRPATAPRSEENGILVIRELIDQAKSASFEGVRFDERLWRIQDRAANVISRIFGDPSEYLEQVNSYFPLFLPANDEDYVNRFRLDRGDLIDLLTRILDNLRLSKVSTGATAMTKTEVKLGDGTVIYGDLVIASSIRDSFNRVIAAEISHELKDTLTDLTKAVARMSQSLPEEMAQQATRDLETLTAGATSKTPRKRWLRLSAEGLKRAAENVGAIGKPVLELVARILPLLKV
jgi:hypothetical protein